MSFEKNDNVAILVAISVIALVLVAAANFNLSYMAFAAPKKGDSSSSDSSTRHTNDVSALGGSPSSSSAASTGLNSNILTKKQLSSLTSCINTANKSEGLTHKVVTNCLDVAKGTASASTTSTSGSPSSIASVATPRS
jgi:hypothetical protein